MATPRLCSITGCGKPFYGLDLCNAHYQRKRIYGDPLAPPHPKVGAGERFYRDVVLTYDSDACLDWPFSKGKNGYAKVCRDKRQVYVHRLACESVHGPAPTPEHQAAHSCGNGHLGCVNRRHLSWKTPKENAADKIVHGTLLRGTAVHMSKLTEKEVLSIRALRGRFTQEEVARQFGVSRALISNIQLGNGWAWLKGGA